MQTPPPAHSLRPLCSKHQLRLNPARCSFATFAWFTVLFLFSVFFSAVPSPAAESIWVEAEWFAPIKGRNFSHFTPQRQNSNSWSLAGPGVAAEWTQGGESEFMSIATRAEEGGGLSCAYSAVVPAAGTYHLWIRYGDYRLKQEIFDVRVSQNGKQTTHRLERKLSWTILNRSS